MPRAFNPLPACPIPNPFDVGNRVQELQAMIDDETTSEEQKVNLRAAIDLYNKRVLPGPSKFSHEFDPFPVLDHHQTPLTMLNDTGSNTHTVFDTDLIALGIPPHYGGYGAIVSIATANGTALRRGILFDIQLLTPQGDAVSDWIREYGVVIPATPGAVRLSGDGIRQSLYFATAPGNRQLYVAAKKKNGIANAFLSLLSEQ